jgi:hypothetical protein
MFVWKAMPSMTLMMSTIFFDDALMEAAIQPEVFPGCNFPKVTLTHAVGAASNGAGIFSNDRRPYASMIGWSSHACSRPASSAVRPGGSGTERCKPIRVTGLWVIAASS